MKKHLLWPILLVFMLGTTFAAPKYGGTLVFGVGGDARVGRRNTALHGCSVDGLVVMMPSRSNLRVDGPTSNSKLISYVGVLGVNMTCLCIPKL